jgi:hypothetical protein
MQSHQKALTKKNNLEVFETAFENFVRVLIFI